MRAMKHMAVGVAWDPAGKVRGNRSNERAVRDLVTKLPPPGVGVATRDKPPLTA